MCIRDSYTAADARMLNYRVFVNSAAVAGIDEQAHCFALQEMEMCIRDRLYLEQRGLRPQRGWGQNFLIDGNVARKIVDAAALSPGDPAVEIGPGAGALTAILALSLIHI